MWEGWTGIDLLIPLQELRESLPDAVTTFFEKICGTFFCLGIPVLLGILIYWLIDKRKGDRYVVNIVTAFNFVNFLKFIFKQPRPWILDSRVHPAEGAMEDAGGYSLPSGHTAIATAGYGYAALLVKKYWLKILLLLICACIIFARLFLGVHTPIDIIFGLAIAIGAMIINGILADISEKSDRNFYIINLIYFVAFTVFFISILINIDMDYLNTYLTIGMLYGMLIGRIVEHRYIHYERPKMEFKKGLLITVFGLAVAGVFLVVPLKILEIDWLCFIGGLLTTAWIYSYPYLIMKWCA